VRLVCLLALGGAAESAGAQTIFNIAGDSANVRVTSLRDMPFRTVVRQQYDYSCGSAALATLLTHHYGQATSEATIFRAMYAAGDQAKIRKVGFSLLDMKRYLAARGLQADGYRWTSADLQHAKTPAIALINLGAYRHFVVVKGVRQGQVLVGDPAQGLKLYPQAEFARMWNGVVFLVSDRPGRQAAYDRREDWSHFQMGPMAPLEDAALASFTRDLPPIYQIVAFRTGGGAIR
jgi:predicted double-glycine peptidase